MSRTARFILVLAVGGGAFLLPVRARDTVRVAALRQTARSHETSVPGELIVQFKAAAEDSRVVGAIQGIGGRWARRSAFGPRYRVALDPDIPVAQAVARLAALPEVDYAEPNGRVRAMQEASPEGSLEDLIDGFAIEPREAAATR